MMTCPPVSSHIIFDFNSSSDLTDWYVVNDGVMGGKSTSRILLNEDGHGIFKGSVSLENNGGFASVHYASGKVLVNQNQSRIVIRLKGDGKDYQFRIRAQSEDRYSYIYSFSTTGKWEEISIPLHEMYPSFRGRKLDMPNFSDAHFEEIAILISNKKEEDFKLILDRIVLQ